MNINQLKNKKFLILLIGHPLVGKSTFIKNKLNNLDFNLISRDNIILDLSYTKEYNKAWDEVNHKEVDRILNKRIDNSILNNESVVIDMTNLTKKRRKGFINRFNDYYKVGILFDILSSDEIKSRNEKRNNEESKYINESIINTMISSYQIPTKEEGFDKIINVNKII